jgi:superkiller protein 3
MMDNGDVSGAEDVLKLAIDLSPSDAKPWSALALLLIQQRKLDAALAAVDHAIGLDQKNPHMVARRAYILSEMGDAASAERALQDVIAMAPTIGGLYSTLGIVLLRQDRISEARTAFHQALQLEPSNSSARYHIERLDDRLPPDSRAVAGRRAPNPTNAQMSS